jgi:hypothetical protein
VGAACGSLLHTFDITVRNLELWEGGLAGLSIAGINELVRGSHDQRRPKAHGRFNLAPSQAHQVSLTLVQ